MNSIVRSSPAKINLFLEVLGKRQDGYHEILTWMHFISIEDSITLKKSKLDYCTLQSRDVTIPFGKRNLCIKAYETVKKETGLDRTVVISLDKSIPLGSGLGGGSSNAASVIMGLNELFELDMGNERMARIGAGIGSDVPFFFSGGSAMASGRGTDITPLPVFPKPLWLVLAKPEVSVSTGDAYQWLKGYKGERRIDVETLSKKIQSGDLDFLRSFMFNAFESVIFERHAQIRELRDEMTASGCIAAHMTGSGSGVFGICENEKSAVAAAKSISDSGRASFVRSCRTL